MQCSARPAGRAPVGIRSAGRQSGLQHAGVAEGVRLDVRQVEELRDALVGAADELRIDVGIDHRLADRREAATREEVDLEGEAEQAREPEVRALTSRPSTIARPTPWCSQSSETISVRTSPRSSHITCRAPQPISRPCSSSRRGTAARPRTARRGPCRGGSAAARTVEQGLDAAHIGASRRTYRELTHAVSLGSPPRTGRRAGCPALPVAACPCASSGRAQSSGRLGAGAATVGRRAIEGPGAAGGGCRVVRQDVGPVQAVHGVVAGPEGVGLASPLRRRSRRRSRPRRTTRILSPAVAGDDGRGDGLAGSQSHARVAHRGRCDREPLEGRTGVRGGDGGRGYPPGGRMRVRPSS